MKFKSVRYVLYGLLFTYFAFGDGNFHWLYNGAAILLALVSFALAFMAYRKNIAENEDRKSQH